MRVLFVFFAMFSVQVAPVVAQPKPKPVKLSLATQYDKLPKDAPFHIVAQVAIDDGWHIYWREPGKFGFSTDFGIKLDGETLGPVPQRWPTPSVYIHDEGGKSYQYHKSFSVLLGPLTVPADAKESLSVFLGARWLECTDEVCVPKKSKVEQSIPLAASLGDLKETAEYESAENGLPKQVLLQTSLGEITQPGDQSSDGSVVFHLSGAPLKELAKIQDPVVAAYIGGRGLHFARSELQADAETLDLHFVRKGQKPLPGRGELVINGFFVDPAGALTRAFVASPG